MKLIELPYRKFFVKGDQTIKEYEEACLWIDSLGLPYAKSRFAQYHDSIKHSLDSIKGEVLEKQVATFRSYLNAYAEATELIRLKSSFSSRKHQEYLEKLKFVVSGQPFRNTSKSDPARNFGFELSMAARLITAGYETDINQLADIVAIIDGRNVYFECKRVISAKKVRERVKSANLQLRRRLLKDKSPGARGVAAINVTDVLNPEYDFIIANTVDEIKSSHSSQMNNFMNLNEATLKTKAIRKILGIMCEYNLYGIVENDKPFDIVNCRGVKFLVYDDRQSSDKLISEIVKRTSNQNIL